MPNVNLALIAPELIVCVVGVVVMLVDAFARPEQRWITGGISLAGLLAAAAAPIWLWLSWGGASQAFNGMIVLDELRLGFHSRLSARLGFDDADFDGLGREREASGR